MKHTSKTNHYKTSSGYLHSHHSGQVTERRQHQCPFLSYLFPPKVTFVLTFMRNASLIFSPPTTEVDVLGPRAPGFRLDWLCCGITRTGFSFGFSMLWNHMHRLFCVCFLFSTLETPPPPLTWACSLHIFTTMPEKYTTIYLSIWLLVDIWVVQFGGLFWMALLGIFLSMCTCFCWGFPKHGPAGS